MEARDEPGKIRPLPPELPEIAAPGSSPPPPPDRRWVPIAVAGAALVFFGLLAGLFGAGSAAGPDASGAGASDTTIPALGNAPPSTTTTTAPPTLGEMAPVLERPLQIVYRDHANTTTNRATWELAAAAPSEVMTSGGAASQASFDASKRQISWITEGRNDTLWVGRPPVAEPVFVGISGAHWHPTEPRLLAWVGTQPGARRPHLYVANALANSGIGDLVDLGAVPPRSELVGWGDWGFALRVAAPVSARQWEVPDPSRPGSTVFQLLEFTVVLGRRGAPRTAIAGTPRAVGPNGELVVQSATAAFAAATAEGFAGEDAKLEIPVMVLEPGTRGEPVVVLDDAMASTGVGFTPVARVMSFHFSPDGRHVAAAGEMEGRFAITIHAVDGSLRRITSVDNVDATLGFSRDSSVLILHDRDGGDLVFHDWNRGASFRVPFAGGQVLAVDG